MPIDKPLDRADVVINEASKLLGEDLYDWMKVCGVVWCSVVWYGMVWYGVVWCGVVWCGVVWCGVVWCGVVWCGVVWCGVVWCGVVWCGVVWCGVVWCVKGAVTKRQWSGWYCTREKGGREGCVSQRMLCIWCVCPLVPTALPWCDGCRSPAVGGTCACSGRGVLVVLPSRHAPPFGLRAVALRAGRAAQSTAVRTGGLEASAAQPSAARSGGLEACAAPTTVASTIGLAACAAPTTSARTVGPVACAVQNIDARTMLRLQPACPWWCPGGPLYYCLLSAPVRWCRSLRALGHP